MAAVSVLLLVSTLACGAPRLEHTCDTAEALASAVLDGLARRDRAALERLALSEDEFRELVWPDLPAARPERNLPWDYVWQDLHQKSRASLGRTLAAHGGRRYELVSVRHLGDTSTYGTYEVRRDAEVTVRNAEGRTQQLRLFGSTLHHAGRAKLFSYVVD